MDYSTVTLLFKRQYQEIDLELPLKLSIEELSKKMVDTLKAIDYRRFASIDSIKLMYNDKMLNPELTLEDYGVWDGSYLVVVES